jgi:hypothetical protein
MYAPRALLLSALLAALLATPALADGPRLVTSLGGAWFEHGRASDRTEASGVALQLQVEGRPAPTAGYAVTLTWGLTDWDRAKEWIDAGNRAGSWTTDKFAEVERWVRRGKRNETEGLRFMGAIFADLFLVLSYAAVPFCYVGSAGGATSHLQLDATGSLHLSDGPNDAWLELGFGAAALPEHVHDWRRALGPVGGLGARFGPVRVGLRGLWSPPGLNTATGGGRVVTGALTVGFVG